MHDVRVVRRAKGQEGWVGVRCMVLVDLGAGVMPVAAGVLFALQRVVCW